MKNNNKTIEHLFKTTPILQDLIESFEWGMNRHLVYKEVETIITPMIFYFNKINKRRLKYIKDIEHAELFLKNLSKEKTVRSIVIKEMLELFKNSSCPSKRQTIAAIIQISNKYPYKNKKGIKNEI